MWHFRTSFLAFLESENAQALKLCPVWGKILTCAVTEDHLQDNVDGIIEKVINFEVIQKRTICTYCTYHIQVRGKTSFS